MDKKIESEEQAKEMIWGLFKKGALAFREHVVGEDRADVLRDFEITEKWRRELKESK